jgi:hypothetical protein
MVANNAIPFSSPRKDAPLLLLPDGIQRSVRENNLLSPLSTSPDAGILCFPGTSLLTTFNSNQQKILFVYRGEPLIPSA